MKNYNRLLLVLNYLMNQSDEDHLVTIKDINAFLSDYKLDADRETIAECIEELQESGYDIKCVRSTQNRYYIHSRPFSVAEVKLLVDAVQSSRFISEQQSREIIEKLSSLVGSYKGEILKRHLYIGSRAKSENKQLAKFVETIHNAITNKRKIRFHYYDYNSEKQKVLRRDGRWNNISPFDLIWNNDMYYIVGRGDHTDTILKYRIDRMADLEILDEPSLDAPEGYEVSGFFEKEFSMMAGNTTSVELLCNNRLMGSIIDKFGEDVHTEVVDEEHFKTTVDVAISGVFFGWVVASGGFMRIIGPKDVVDKFEETLKPYFPQKE